MEVHKVSSGVFGIGKLAQSGFADYYSTEIKEPLG
jgi:hypothetical protein